MSLVGDSTCRIGFILNSACTLDALTAQKVGLEYARIADEHMNAKETLAYPAEGVDQLLIVAEVALTSKDLALACYLFVQRLPQRLSFNGCIIGTLSQHSPR